MGPAELPVAPPPARYGAIALGAFVGGTLGGAAGLAASTAFGGDPADKVVPIIGLTFVALWVGTTMGAAAALKLRDDRLTIRTTVMVAAGFLAWSVVSVPSVFWTLDSAPARGPGAIAARLALAAMLTVPPALAARWILLANEKLPERE